MKTIVVGNQKGGVGKTTICTNLAVAAALDGKRVLLIDADTQASSMAFRAVREQEGKDDISAVSIVTPTVHKDVSKFSNFDLVFIDAGGRDNALFRSAVSAAAQGLFLVPVLPSAYDVWATEDTFKILAEARAFVDISAYAIFNQLMPKTIMSKEAQEALAEATKESNVTLLQTALVSRQEYKKSASKGQGVIESEPNGKAAQEINALYIEIKKLIREA